MIDKQMISRAIAKRIIKLIFDPNTGSGTVCSIGNNWFYFGGLTAEQQSPYEYVNSVPEDDIVCEIFETLDDFRGREEFKDEYNYYEAFLNESMNHSNNDRTYTVTEWCSECENEVEMTWDTDVDGYKAFCPYCGSLLMLCDECKHSEDNPYGKCDWKCDFSGNGYCFRKERGKR